MVYLLKLILTLIHQIKGLAKLSNFLPLKIQKLLINVPKTASE
jgi:hypothetical protein